jgi:hypothetical protein
MVIAEAATTRESQPSALRDIELAFGAASRVATLALGPVDVLDTM